MKKSFPFRIWYYFRQGWTTYFAFVFAAINTLTVTFYLAIDKVPELQLIFPSFIQYVLIVAMTGIPILTIIGYIHFKRSSAYRSEADISMEVNPYFRRILLNTEMIIPLHLKLSEVIVKLSKNEKLDESQLEEISKLQSDLKTHISLQDGIYKRDKIENSSIKKLKELDDT